MAKAGCSKKNLLVKVNEKKKMIIIMKRITVPIGTLKK